MTARSRYKIIDNICTAVYISLKDLNGAMVCSTKIKANVTQYTSRKGTARVKQDEEADTKIIVKE